MSLMRIWSIAANGFREVIRDRIFYFVGFFSLVLVIALRLLPEISVGTDKKIFVDLGLAAIEALTVIVAVFIGTNLINKEIEKRTILVLIAKPISRVEFILGKHLGLSAVLWVLVAAMTLVYLILLNWAQIPHPLPSILVSLGFLCLQLSLLTAVAIAFGVFTSSILATLLSLGVYLMGQISRDILALGKLSDNATLERLTKFIYLFLPDLSRLNLKNEAVYNILPSPPELLANVIYAICYTIFLLVFAMLIFSKRQF
ncbi:MAG: ABC transporter permease [Gloeocapsa sp. DLM2.Bin57]|nr:MAG: ABC transporter permease [Gloeocapsa sp. DLM2.Bin57]